MLRPEMNLPERSEFSSQALLLIRFQILYFSQIPEWNKDPTSRISVPFYPGNSEYFSVFSCFLKFGIVGDTADWMCAENSGIQTDGCAFPGKTVWGFGDFGIAVVKLKTGNPALRFTMELSARNASFHCESCF